jgi:hypothetical protein
MSGKESGFGGKISIPVLALFPGEDGETIPDVAMAVYIAYEEFIRGEFISPYSDDGWHTFIDENNFDRCTSHGGKPPVAWVELPAYPPNSATSGKPQEGET